jgi:hypothetical protein
MSIKEIVDRHNAWNRAYECNDATKQCNADRDALLIRIKSMEAAFKKIQRTTLKNQRPGVLLDEVYSIAATALIKLKAGEP